MTIQNALGWLVGVLLIVGFFTFLYFLLVKAHLSNMPMATRGLGIVLLAGTLKVIVAMATRSVSSPAWVNGALIAMAVVGVFMMMSGLAKGE